MKLEPSCRGFCNCYFCEMLKLQKNTLYFLYALAAILVSSCEGMFNKVEEKEPLARVDDTFLKRMLPLLSEMI